jgi:UDP-N-acetylmuramoyl-L-alanyl-D-glutamate--2,6-diaminopimelate ligase
VQVSGISLDSRRVKPGDLFVALEGGNTDGHLYIPEAVKQGATAIVGTQALGVSSVPYLRVEDGRRALAELSASFYGFPAREMTVIGVTGTDGKTTTANLIYQILKAAGIQTGMISTVNAQIGEKVLDTGFHVTTPEAPDVQLYLAEMVAAGLSHVVLEATSHGLDQQRVAGCEIDVAVVTNITHEHLDYHGSYENYRAAKGRLFTDLATTVVKVHGNPRVAVLNFEDSSYDYLSAAIQGLATEIRAFTYGFQPEADLKAENIIFGPGGMRFTALSIDRKIEVTADLIGEYNVSNCLAAICATVLGLGLDERFARQGIATMETIPGRMEMIDRGQEFLAIVDFAHTPNALSRALETARQLSGGAVIAVFGSAGLRDREKRRLMAEISAELADLTIFTAEDPRTESLESILGEMTDGAISAGGIEGQTFWRIPDRGEAIKMALKMAKPGDVVIACGKGHEQSMCFGEIEYPWDDRTAMEAALSEFLGLPGPTMPFLPTQDDL